MWKSTTAHCVCFSLCVCACAGVSCTADVCVRLACVDFSGAVQRKLTLFREESPVARVAYVSMCYVISTLGLARHPNTQNMEATMGVFTFVQTPSWHACAAAIHVFNEVASHPHLHPHPYQHLPRMS